MKPAPDANSFLFPARGRAASAHYAAKVVSCVVCGKTAIFRVGANGYCRTHKADAERHALTHRRKATTRYDTWTGERYD